MSSGPFILYTSGLKYILEGTIDLENTCVAYALHNGYVPGTSSHSVLAQIAPYRSTAGGTPLAPIYPGATGFTGVTQSGNVAIKFGFSSYNSFTAGGSAFNVKYCALVQSVGANLILGIYDLNIGGGNLEATQVDITINSNVVFKINTNINA